MLEDLIETVEPITWNDKYPDFRAVNYWKMAANRIFYVEGEINEDILELQKEIIDINFSDFGIPVEERRPIIIMLNTPGGLLAETMSVAATIKMSKTPVYTVNTANALSGGILLLIAGHKRYTFKYSTAMCHSGSSGGVGTFEQLEASQEQYKRSVKQMGEFILENTTIEKRVYDRNKSKDWYMTAEDQVKYGVADEIVDSMAKFEEIVGVL